MVSIELARQLSDAGLVWMAELHDFFAIPNSDLAHRVFVVSDVMAQLETLRGWPAVTFHGTAEWALDYIFTHEVVWIPTERQIRQVLAQVLAENEEEVVLQLSKQGDHYRCEIMFQGLPQYFEAEEPSDAYGKALLHVFNHS